MTIQFPTIILPTVWNLGTETEVVLDILEHTSIEVPVEFLQEKLIQVVAREAVVLGVPGNLWMWVELSPVQSTTSAAYWSAIGGGGGVLPPAAPVVIVGTGVTGTIHPVLLPWTMHGNFARLVVQTPVLVATAGWAIQALISGKGAS